MNERGRWHKAIQMVLTVFDRAAIAHEQYAATGDKSV